MPSFSGRRTSARTLGPTSRINCSTVGGNTRRISTLSVRAGIPSVHGTAWAWRISTRRAPSSTRSASAAAKSARYVGASSASAPPWPKYGTDTSCAPRPGRPRRTSGSTPTTRASRIATSGRKATR